MERRASRPHGGVTTTGQAPEPQTGSKADARRLTLPQLAKLLERAGASRASEHLVAAAVDAGAPVNPDGTVSVVQFTAWLAREEARGGR